IENNPHLGSGDRIYPAQVLFLGNEVPTSPRPAASDLVEMEGVFKYGSKADSDFLLSNFEILQYLSQQDETPDPNLFSGLNFSHFLPGALQLTKASKEVLSLSKKVLNTGVEAASGRF